jgi:hypothetical protein
MRTGVQNGTASKTSAAAPLSSRKNQNPPAQS